MSKKDRCRCCDRRIRVMAFQKTGFCSNLCRKLHRHHTKESSAVHPSSGGRPRTGAENLAAITRGLSLMGTTVEEIRRRQEKGKL